ncbi:MAG: 50S ribosomal protein L10 [Candidatus Omnitrophota bacterium]
MKVGQLYRKSIADNVQDGLTKKSNTFVVTWRGISSSKMSTLRKDLKRKKADVLVSKNSIARLAFKNSNYEDLGKSINGQMAIVLSDSDASEISKVLINFSKKYEGFTVQGGILDGALLNSEEVKTLSDLPSREVLLSKFFGTLQAPVTRFAGALNAKSRDFVSILKQKSEKGGN